MRKKKLIFISNNLNFFITHRLLIAETALAKGFDVAIVYGELGGADHEFLVHKGFKLIFIPMYRGAINIMKNFKTFFYLWILIKKENPDIVHLISIKPYLYGGIISRLARVPAVVSAVSGMGSLFISKSFKSIFLRIILYPFYKLAFNHPNQTVIFHNKDDLKLFVDWGILNPIKAKILKGSGVNLNNFKNFNDPKGITKVCLASRLLQDKGVYEYESAAKILKDKGIIADFYLAGDIDAKNPSTLSLEYVNKLKRENIVKVLGYQEDIAGLYAKSHIVCLPSYREGMPKSLLEAASAGRAIVTTDVPGCRDSIIPNKTGLIIPAKDSQKLADAIKWLIDHPKERIAMGTAGRKLAEKEYAIENIVQNHLNIYEELLEEF